MLTTHGIHKKCNIEEKPTLTADGAVFGGGSAYLKSPRASTSNYRREGHTDPTTKKFYMIMHPRSVLDRKMRLPQCVAACQGLVTWAHGHPKFTARLGLFSVPNL